MTSTNGEYVVTFAYEANEGGARTATIDFVSGEETITVEVTQLGGIADVTVAEFLAAEVGEAQYRVTGILTKVAKAEYGNIYVKDATGEMYVYGVGSKGDFEKLGLKVGDIVTLVGKRAAYNNSPQMGGGQYVSHKPVTTVNAADVAALADDDKTNPANYIMLTGKVSQPVSGKFDLETYGNFDLVDESGRIYVYGVSTGWNGETKKFASLGVKEGDTITIVAYKTSYNGNAQVVGMYVSHEAAPAGDDNTGTEGGDDNTGDTPAEETVVVFDYTQVTETNTSYTGTTVDGVTLTGFRIATNKSGQLRIYAPNSEGNATLTLNSGDKKMTKIEFTFTGAENVGPLSASGYADGVWTGEANEVTFTNDGTAQARVTQIKVTLK
jgi:RPA family protein